MNVKITNDPDLRVCPKCLEDDASVTLVTAKDGKYCPYHGKITERKA